MAKRETINKTGGKKALFKVEHGKQTFLFFKKKTAKKHRDTIPGAVVSRGPDHWRGESFRRYA